MHDNCLTVCVTCMWAGVDSLWEQEKLEARKMIRRVKLLEIAAESPVSGSIIKRDTADRCQVGRQVRPSCSKIAVSLCQVIPNSCKVLKTEY